jgi:hypothetical protein
MKCWRKNEIGTRLRRCRSHPPETPEEKRFQSRRLDDLESGSRVFGMESVSVAREVRRKGANRYSVHFTRQPLEFSEEMVGVHMHARIAITTVENPSVKRDYHNFFLGENGS